MDQFSKLAIGAIFAPYYDASCLYRKNGARSAHKVDVLTLEPITGAHPNNVYVDHSVIPSFCFRPKDRVVSEGHWTVAR